MRLLLDRFPNPAVPAPRGSAGSAVSVLGPVPFCSPYVLFPLPVRLFVWFSVHQKINRMHSLRAFSAHAAKKPRSGFTKRLDSRVHGKSLSQNSRSVLRVPIQQGPDADRQDPLRGFPAALACFSCTGPRCGAGPRRGLGCCAWHRKPTWTLCAPCAVRGRPGVCDLSDFNGPILWHASRMLATTAHDVQ